MKDPRGAQFSTQLANSPVRKQTVFINDGTCSWLFEKKRFESFNEVLKFVTSPAKRAENWLA
jgi:hypothetical protein